jgi:hypothetical protein
LIQENENYRQRGFGRFLDTVSSNYGKLIAMKNINVDTLLYVLVIAGVFQQVQGGLDRYYGGFLESPFGIIR